MRLAADSCDRVAAVHGLSYTAADLRGGHHNYQLPLFGLSLMLVGGGAIQHFFSGIPLPYTVMLLLFGVVLGCWVLFDPAFTLRPGTMAGDYEWEGHVLQCNVTQPIANDLHFHGWHLGNSLRMFAEMDPHLLLHVLLPPLLFESAFAIDWHIFHKLSWYAVFLALPGLVVATVLTGLTYAALYGWCWEACMLIGGILSATDPVAVVALLREMGVKKSLATLIEAESLLNDGTAVVVFSILLKAVQQGGLQAWLDEEDKQWYHIVWVTVRMSVVGPLMGVVLGMLSVRWLEANQGADRDANVEVICTLAMPFLVFYLAETAFSEEGDFQMSGVLAVVAFGLVFASPYGQVRIDPGVEHFLHEFWGMVGHLVNTLIFVMAGIIIILNVFGENFDPASFWPNLGKGLAVYVAMTVYRALVMFGVLPLFSKSQYGYTWRDALVITWGGLRGAVGLALAVAVARNDAIVDCNKVDAGSSGSSGSSSDGGAEPACSFAGSDDFRQIVLFHTCLTVALTLLVNAPTTGALLRAIGLTKLAPEKVSMLQSTEDRLKAKQAEVLKRLCRHPVNSDVNWEGVARLASFEAMVSAILGRPEAVHDDSIDWHPEGDSGGHAGDHHHGDHAIVAHAADAVVQAAAAAFSGLMGGLGGGGFVANRKKRSSKEAVGALKEAVGMRKSPSEIALVAEDGAAGEEAAGADNGGDGGCKLASEVAHTPALAGAANMDKEDGDPKALQANFETQRTQLAKEAASNAGRVGALAGVAAALEVEEGGAAVTVLPEETPPTAAALTLGSLASVASAAKAASRAAVKVRHALPKEQQLAIYQQWRRLGCEYRDRHSSTAEMIGEFKERLSAKRLREAKFRLLERLRAQVHKMYEDGLILPATSTFLHELVIDQLDYLDTLDIKTLAAAMRGGAAPEEVLPFAPLAPLLKRRAATLAASRALQRLASSCRLFAPLSATANQMLFREFERGYDATAGYLLAHEEVLHEHGHGAPFSIDAAVERRLMQAIEKNIKESVAALALMRLDWPQMCTAINTFKASRIVLNAGKALILDIRHHGGIGDTECSRLLDLIAEQAVKLKALPPTDALKASEREHFIPEEMGAHSRASIYAAEQELELKKQAQQTRMLRRTSTGPLASGKWATMRRPSCSGAPAPETLWAAEAGAAQRRSRRGSLSLAAVAVRTATEGPASSGEDEASAFGGGDGATASEGGGAAEGGGTRTPSASPPRLRAPPSLGARAPSPLPLEVAPHDGLALPPPRTAAVPADAPEGEKTTGPIYKVNVQRSGAQPAQVELNTLEREAAAALARSGEPKTPTAARAAAERAAAKRAERAGSPSALARRPPADSLTHELSELVALRQTGALTPITPTQSSENAGAMW